MLKYIFSNHVKILISGPVWAQFISLFLLFSISFFSFVNQMLDFFNSNLHDTVLESWPAIMTEYSLDF